MMVERRIENRIVAEPPILSITREQRRLIEYWKTRFKFGEYHDEVAAQRLSIAFQEANADDEELRYWREAGNTSTIQERLIAVFVRQGSFDDLRQWYESQCEDEDWDGALPWQSLRELRARRTGLEQNDSWELINLYRMALTRDPETFECVETFTEESKAQTRVEDRIKMLKSGLECLNWGDDCDKWWLVPGLLIVEELERLLLNQEYAFTF